ncbi:MAG: undecaprenyl-diphosphate phosphatase [Stomatobaculum sp.]
MSDIIEILKIIVLGMVEGFTEWIPISSTGHLMLVEKLLQPDVSATFMEMFRVVIQLGAILAVVVLYFRRLNPLAQGKKPAQRRATWILWSKIAVACLPVAVLGLLLDDWLDIHFYNDESKDLVVSLMLILYGILFIVFEMKNHLRSPLVERTGKISYHMAFYIGIFQVLALIPGTSRSGATILGGMMLGCSRAVAAEFSFFLGIPVMFGASLLKLKGFGLHFSLTEFFYLLLGMAVAFLVSVYSIRFLMGWVKKNDFKVFGYYRIVLGVIVLIWYIISSLVNSSVAG